MNILQMFAAVISMALITNCSINYDHRLLEREGAAARSGKISIFPSLYADGNRTGNRSWAPWQLVVLVESDGSEHEMVLRRATLRREDGQFIPIVGESNSITEVVDGRKRVTFRGPSVDFEFREGEVLSLDLAIQFSSESGSKTIREKFRFVAKRVAGRTKFNPFLDIT